MYASPWRGLRSRPWNQEHDALERWLKSLRRPLAIMACNDVRAQHVLDAARSLGIAVPEELAVVGVDDDYPLCDLCDPPLSSVVPNAQRIGYEAAHLLDRLMSGERSEPSETLIEPLGVVTRQSTDVLAIDDPGTAAALRHIREHACGGLKMQELLRHVAISRPVLERRFRKFLDRSPQAEIRRVQIARSKQLLAETELPLKAIAGMTGFKHPEYLNVMFKRETGSSRRVSPERDPAGEPAARRRPDLARSSRGHPGRRRRASTLMCLPCWVGSRSGADHSTLRQSAILRSSQGRIALGDHKISQDISGKAHGPPVVRWRAPVRQWLLRRDPVSVVHPYARFRP